MKLIEGKDKYKETGMFGNMIPDALLHVHHFQPWS